MTKCQTGFWGYGLASHDSAPILCGMCCSTHPILAPSRFPRLPAIHFKTRHMLSSRPFQNHGHTAAVLFLLVEGCSNAPMLGNSPWQRKHLFVVPYQNIPISYSCLHGQFVTNVFRDLRYKELPTFERYSMLFDLDATALSLHVLETFDTSLTA